MKFDIALSEDFEDLKIEDNRAKNSLNFIIMLRKINLYSRKNEGYGELHKNILSVVNNSLYKCFELMINFENIGLLTSVFNENLNELEHFLEYISHSTKNLNKVENN